ncbi:MAG TPA: fatty acid desaturase [Polyangiaceae bacterium]|nr:fatty acid desaturase [Polyangiaceae bacterium]
MQGATLFAAAGRVRPCASDSPHRAPSRPSPSKWQDYHGPTYLVCVLIYAGWFAATYFHAELPSVVLAALGGWIIAWHSSLQHETIHGNPRGPRWLRRLIGAPPLSLWLPYRVYVKTHAAHHRTEHLTLPGYDPESHFLSGSAWSRLGPARRTVYRASRTLAGRLLLGPPLTIVTFLHAQARLVARGDRPTARAWLEHTGWSALILVWLYFVCDMSLVEYVLLFVYPGASLSLLRSFAEHRAELSPSRRTAIVNAGPVLSLLFLNNNLHAAHHAKPTLPWFRLPEYYRQHARSLLRDNGGYLIADGYLGLLRRFGFRPISSPIHPVGR